MWTLGRLDAKSDHHGSEIARQGEKIDRILTTVASVQRSLDQTILALKRSTQSPVRTTVAVSEAPSEETFLMTAVKHFGPKALLWILGHGVRFLIQYLLPAALLLWGLSQKWILYLAHWLWG